ncbi:MAG: sulfite dehydrogenase [Sphingobacteriaceae bacterium]|nr:MAG: sulfite dehydrogenase [Sphingobacteriaceae bacterium]
MSKPNKINTASIPGSKLSRRKLLGGVAAAGILYVQSAFGKAAKPSLSPVWKRDIQIDRTPGPGASKVGSRSLFEQPARKTTETSSRTPLHELYSPLTPADLHYERHHSGIPVIDPEKYELLIHGMVEKPIQFTLRDLKRFPAVTRTCFLECSGNFRTGRENMTAQEICGMTSQSEWTGVMLSTLLREVGLKPKATWFLAEGGDAALLSRSIPVTKGLDDAMIVYAQNGEAVRPEQGYPARLLLPGWEGNTSVKWLRRIEVSDQPFMTREETSKYTDPVKDRVRQFSFEMDARSIITSPSYPAKVEPGWIEIRGLAWTGWGKVLKVEVTTNAGKSWQNAQLQEPVLSKAHVYFRYLWYWDGSETEIASRVTDETGYTQPTMKQLIDARGLDFGVYHLNPVTSWLIKQDGAVLAKPQVIK